MINEKEMVQELSTSTNFSKKFRPDWLKYSLTVYLVLVSQKISALYAVRPLALKNKFKPIQNDLKYLVGEENSLVCLQPFL